MLPNSERDFEFGDDYFIVDRKDLRTKTIEKLVSPLVSHVTNLSGPYFNDHRVTGDPIALRKKCADAILQLYKVGGRVLEQIKPLITPEALEKTKSCLDTVGRNGEEFLKTSAVFVQNTSDVSQRIRTSEAGRILLMSVVKLLIQADMLDLQKIMDQTDKIRHLIDAIGGARTEAELMERLTVFHNEMQELTELTKRRLKDMNDPAQVDDLMTSMRLLKITTPIMISSSKTYIQHPEIHEAKALRDFSHNQMQEALIGVKCALNGEVVPTNVAFSQHGALDALPTNLDRFQSQLYMDHKSYRPEDRRKLEKLLETIIGDTAIIAEWPMTRPTRRNQIIQGNNNLREALQQVLKQYEKNVGYPEASDDLEYSIDNAMAKIKELRRHLRRTIADHVSDAFIDTRTPLACLIDAARSGDFERTEQAAQEFEINARNMIDVARRVCDISSDQEANKIIRYNAMCLETLVPQVINAALLLCEKPNSAAVRENMDAFAAMWTDRVKLLTMAVDRMISIVDFLAVNEALIANDTMEAIRAIIEGEQPDWDKVDRSAGAIRGRSLRICEVVNEEMNSLQPSSYSDNVRSATRRLNDVLRQQFVSKASGIVNRLKKNEEDGTVMERAEREAESEEMISTSGMIEDAVRDIRTAVLMNQNPEDVDSDNEYIDDGATGPMDNASQISDNDGDNQQLILRKLPEESKNKIQEQIDLFNITQRKFMREVGKWDSNGNELIKLAKDMCFKCDEMTQFTKGRGPLKRTKDVIETAQIIATKGNELNALASSIGNDCVESETKKDLYAYINRISTLSHQLRITSRVKADIQHVGDKLEVKGLDSVTSLIQNVKNLLNEVILCVRAAYIASTKFPSRDGHAPRVRWSLAHPNKQPLIRPQTNQGVIRRASERRPQQPLQALDEFTSEH